MFIVTTALKKLFKLKKRKRCIRGGTSASKTFSIIPILIDKAMKIPNREISIVSESMPHLKRGCIRDFIKIMVATGRFDPIKWNKSSHTYTFSNGSFIEFFSADMEAKLRGARRHDLYVNECNNVTFEAYLQLAIRTSGDIWLDYNPVAPFWVDSQLIGQPDVDVLTLTYKDNEALSQTIIDEIESAREKGKTSKYWANWWRVYGLGMVGSLEGACIPDWEEIPTLPSEARLLCLGLDWGYTNDETTIIGLYKLNDGYIFHEFCYETGLLNSHISNKIKGLGLAKDVIIYADSAEPKSIQELKNLGHIILPTKKGADSIVNGIALINQQKISVTASSTNLIHELTNYIWMKDKEGNKINKPISKFDHAIDAIRYAVTMQLSNPHKGEYHLW